MNLKRNWRIFLTMLMVGLVAFGTTLTGFNASTVPGVPSGNGVFPYVEPVNDPNVYCDTEGEILATKVKLNQDTPGEYSLLEGKITATIYEDDGYTGLNFTSEIPISYVYVKGGPEGGNMYLYDPPSFGDTGLYTPVNPSNNTPSGISHVTFYYCEPQYGCLTLTKDFLGVPEGYILPAVTGSILGQYGDTYNFTLDETNGYSQTLCGLYPGQYTVTEDPILGFTTTYPNGNTAMVVAGDMADAVVINIRNIYEVAQRPSIEVSNVTITNADKFNGTASGTFDITNMSGGDSTWVTLGEVSVSFVARGRGGIRGVFSAIYTLSPVDATGYTLSPKETMTFTYECTQMDWVSGNLINLEDARELTAVVNVAGAWNQLGEFRDRIWTDTSSPYPLD
jgi:hypothetical protein